jgi:hypothetical protein
MPGLRRATPEPLVLELTRQLAEQYDTIPLPKVAAVVQAAVARTAGPDGRLRVKARAMPAAIDVIEALAREDLDQLRDSFTPAPSVPAPPAAARSGRRRGVA